MNHARLQVILGLIGGGVCGVALMCAATGASAQLAVYKQVDPAGRILYTDQADAPASASPESAPESDDRPAPARRAVSSRRSALVNINEAQRRLAQAQLKHKQDRAPLPGERVHASSGETVTYAYWKRQEKLRIEVERAQRRVNALQRPQLARQ